MTARWAILLTPLLLGGCEQQSQAPERMRIRYSDESTKAVDFRVERRFEQMVDRLRERIESGEVERDVRVDFGAGTSQGALTASLHHLAAAGIMTPDGFLGFRIDGQQVSGDFQWSVPLLEICCDPWSLTDELFDEWGAVQISQHYHYGPMVEYELICSDVIWTSGTQWVEPETLEPMMAQRKSLSACALVTLVVDPERPAGALLPVLEACHRTGTRFHLAMEEDHSVNAPRLSGSKSRGKHPALIPPRVLTAMRINHTR